jgi:hypothetical protein
MWDVCLKRTNKTDISLDFFIIDKILILNFHKKMSVRLARFKHTFPPILFHIYY